MEQGPEQNKTEEPTAFKLKRAREKGTVARGIDLAFFSTLTGLSLYSLIVGEHTVRDLSEAMRRVLSIAPDVAHDPQLAIAIADHMVWPALNAVALLCATVAGVVILSEVIQLRGIVFTTAPLKPDFSRLNPAKGLKRLFSLRMLKETVKNIVKMVAYCAGAYLVVRHAFSVYGQTATDTTGLADALRAGGFRMLFTFALLALAFAIIDQVLARREFLKQMRMSRSELMREHKEREGEPRLKQKRKQLHAEFAKQMRSIGGLPGSDMLIVNPQHYAVALAYDAKTMTAPTVTAKGRNRFALTLKSQAASQNIATFEHPPLARALFRRCEKGAEVPPAEYRAVADLYLKLARLRSESNHAEV